MRKLPRVSLTCQHCNILFEVIETRANKAKYCSHKCYELGSIGRKAWNEGINIHSEEEKEKRSERMLGDKNPMYGKNHTKEAKDKMKGERLSFIPWNKGKKFPGFYANINRVGENNAYVKHVLKEEGISYSEYLNSIEEKDLYYRRVYSITKLQPIHLLDNYKERGRASYHLDHIYPISKGFKNKIAPEIIGDISNLRFIPWLQNLQKANKLL